MGKQLQKAVPAWHAEAVTMLKGNFAKIHATFCDATKRAVWLGFFIVSIKERGKADGSIPHGQFMPWLAQHFPDISERQLRVYQALARNVAEKGHVQIADFRLFENGGSCRFEELPDKVLKLIEGKTQDQLMFSFKQVEDVNDGELRAKRGRAKGQGGATREQRNAHQQKLQEMDLRARRALVTELGNACERAAEDTGLLDPELADERATALPKIAKLFHLLMDLEQKRGA